MTTRYTIDLKLDGDQVAVILHHHTSRGGHSHPIGKFDKPEYAGAVASFIQNALHDEYQRGLKDAYDAAIESLHTAVKASGSS